MVIGVLNRVEELADRPEGFVPKNHIPFRTLLPLSELLSIITGKAVATKTTWKLYNQLVKDGKTELDILLKMPEAEIVGLAGEKIAEIILKNRSAQIHVDPGYDGEYGTSDDVFNFEKRR